MLQDFTCPADVDVGGDMPVMSMVDKTYMYIRTLKRETQEVSPDSFKVDMWEVPSSKERYDSANPADMLWVMTRYLSSIWNKSYLGLVVWFQF
jgi:hypothetical protein